MREYLEKLLALLGHKHEVLCELIDRQEDLRRFLIKPEWSHFLETTQPLEQLLNRLRQIQSAQDYLMGELARRLRLRGRITLEGLCPCLESEWRKPLRDCIEEIREAVRRLRGANHVGRILQQAQQRFANQVVALTGGPSPSPALYNAHGYTHTIAGEHRFVREV